ncbi:class I SAM-dependent DNA methyltransferase [Garciella nitratireducens]|uniref:class I SAM-dependent DNA methyltransferase n=1 Tax=Garciella nitratireducens TaxID=218205 RepID=UPI000DE8C16E|nr:class I SAM-dependent methyltransferase [Garciella nitratireducens]RBP46829.1 methyltransferase family protein [Garciella nitratireducens]
MYQQFAQVYDILMMEDIDYFKWAKYLEEIFDYWKCKPKNIIDLACGTGNITISLAQMGYDMVGIDISQDMLAIAEQKARKLSIDIQWLHQDMKRFQGFRDRDAIICVCDGMNYILKENDLKEIFSRIYSSLRKNGIFVFDMNSKYKIEKIFAGQTFAYGGEKVSYIWENYYDKEENIIDYELSFFVKRGEYYQRFDEFHQQKAYSIEKIIRILQEVGFQNIDYYHAFSLDKPVSTSERIQYVAQK